MKKTLFLLAIIFTAKFSFGQKIESIHFNLYTDSLKKGFYNYINVDGKSADGQWFPLDSTTIIFTANTGFFQGNDLFIDSSYKGETVTVKASLKGKPSVSKEVTIYIRKRPFTEILKSSDDILSEMQQKRKKSKG